jgi:hypothetical protein
MAPDSAPIMSCLERWVFDENRRKLLFSSGVGGSGWAPIEGEQSFEVSSAERRGKAPPSEGGRGKYSPLAGPDRVTAKACKRENRRFRSIPNTT